MSNDTLIVRYYLPLSLIFSLDFSCHLNIPLVAAKIEGVAIKAKSIHAVVTSQTDASNPSGERISRDLSMQ